MDEPHAGLPRSLRRLLRFAERHGHRPLGHDHLGRTVAAARTPKLLPAATRLAVERGGRAAAPLSAQQPLPSIPVQRVVTRPPPPTPQPGPAAAVPVAGPVLTPGAGRTAAREQAPRPEGVTAPEHAPG